MGTWKLRYKTQMSCECRPPHVSPDSLITVLGMVYAHRKTADGGDLYLTRLGMCCSALLQVENWYETDWFTAHRERLDGTSTVYRVPTKTVNGESMDLVVKNCRVGENVPGDTQTLLEFLNAEFNSPWEEFSLTMELREGKYGDPDLSIHTQSPLAIYVPSETMQPWQSGRSIDRLKRIEARHPGINIDILKQYKLVYGWIHGNDLVECLQLLDLADKEFHRHCLRFTQKSIDTLTAKGFAVADMKPSHIIIGETHVEELKAIHASGGNAVAFIELLMDTSQYSIIDYELLARTSAHEKEVIEARRRIYLNVQKDRFEYSSLPLFLKATTVRGVPYVFGHTESTGGRLWVVGRNGELFDYFLPERWRCTHSWKLSKNTDIFYTVTKDHIHLVWKISRVGERPQPDPDHPHAEAIVSHGFNSPFEEFAIAHDLLSKGVGTVYIRAIYRTGSARIVPTMDDSRYLNHTGLVSPEGVSLLQSDYNYITLRGYFNGRDAWIAAHNNELCRPLDLGKAVEIGYISPSHAENIMNDMLERIYRAGYDGCFLSMDDFLIAVTPENTLLQTEDDEVDIRVCNFELIKYRT